MARSVLLCWILLALCGGLGEAQLNIQNLLNQYCAENPTNQGCEHSHQGARPRPGQSGPVTCSSTSRQCTSLANFCVPNSISCDVVGSGRTCELPVGFAYTTQILLCGDGTPVGVRCGDESRMPVLTQLLVQCHGANTDTTNIKELGVLAGPGTAGGAGVYRCGSSGSWEPLFASPFLNQLLSSCTNAGCGRLPQPQENVPVHRRWSWVRAVYLRGRIHCTATIVSQNAVVTAAHCLTRSLTSRQLLDPFHITIELPGPNQDYPQLNITPSALFVHPRYLPQRGRINDLAVMTFRPPTTHQLPVVCLAQNSEAAARDALKLVFGLDSLEGAGGRPRWTTMEARRDAACRPETARDPSCQSLSVQPFQFCATHPGLSLIQGSSGGPFLTEVGSKLSVEEVWVLTGVLSQFTNQSSCSAEHSVYSHVAENTKWISNCVFNGRCN